MCFLYSPLIINYKLKHSGLLGPSQSTGKSCPEVKMREQYVNLVLEGKESYDNINIYFVKNV